MCGDSVTACVAALLGLDAVDEVPDWFGQFARDAGAAELAMHRWLDERGIACISVLHDELAQLDQQHFDSFRGFLVISLGQSPRSDNVHAVLGMLNDRREWELIHDPHFSNAGLAPVMAHKRLFRMRPE
ncbi:MAG: hypothetical protein DI597_05395 [Pseudoxanthomonas spadix]|nr:MAG: hypothetical protein DI597_05395 [Pseudoxanthomonas spadix]